jgi:hypothetical protein
LLSKFLFTCHTIIFWYYLPVCLYVVFPDAADIHIDRARKIREDSMSDALSLATESNNQVQGLLQKTKGALSRLYSMIFPKLSQNKSLGEMADSFFIESS